MTAAAQVVVRDGYEGMTTTRVAERAGVSVGSLYQYFPSKDALLYALLDRKLRRTSEVMGRAAAESAGEPLRARVRALMVSLLAVKTEYGPLGTELARQAPRLEKQGLMQRMTESSRALVRDLIDDHRDELELSDPDLAAFMVVHAVTGIIDGAIVGVGPLELGDPALVEHLTGLVLHLVGEARSLGPLPRAPAGTTPCT